MRVTAFPLLVVADVIPREFNQDPCDWLRHGGSLARLV